MVKKNRILKYPVAAIFLAAVLFLIIVSLSGEENNMQNAIQLPEPLGKGEISLEEAINLRESVRSFSPGPLSLEDVSQLLWAAGGLRVDTVTRHSRTYPSAGALHPLEFYLAAGEVEGLDSGIYRYNPASHSLVQISRGDVREQLSRAALGQAVIRRAAVCVVISADFAKVAPR